MKDKGCIGCKHFFECEGKPEGVDLCIKFEPRYKNIKQVIDHDVQCYEEE